MQALHTYINTLCHINENISTKQIALELHAHMKIVISDVNKLHLWEVKLIILQCKAEKRGEHKNICVDRSTCNLGLAPFANVTN